MSRNSIKINRILTLDVFRGLTIVLMILVNSPGTKNPYLLLDHATWNGCTLADLVFPSFLFIVGLTSVINLAKHKTERGEKRALLYQSIMRRSLILFALGLFLNIFPYPIHLDSLRIYGVLQRIALCYFFSAIIYLNTSTKTQIFIFGGILLGYWCLMTLIPVPGLGANDLTEAGSWEAYVDQLIFSSHHLFGKVYDPEGLLSTIPSIATTLSGVLTGSLLLSNFSKLQQFKMMILTGVIFLLLGWLWDFTFPINKNLWTSSFVLWCAGYSLSGFAFCFYIIDIAGYTRWALPLKIFGMNALFAFIFHVLLLKIQNLFVFQLKDGSYGNLKVVITDYFFGNLNSQNAALLYALCFIFLNFLVVSFLYYRKIFIRI